MPYAPPWLNLKGSAKKKQVAKSPEDKMPTPDSKLSQSVHVSGKKKKKSKGKKKAKAHKLQEGDLADGEQASDVSGFVKGQSPTLSTKDETFVTVEEIDPQEEEMVRIKKEPMSPTLPKATVFQEAVAPEGSVADEHFSTPLQSPVPTKSELTKENAPLRSESRVPLPRYPPFEHAKRSASPSPSSQLHAENPTALMSLLNNINSRNEKNSTMKARSPQKFKLTPVPNSTLDQNFPPTSPLNSKTPGPMPRMMQFDSSPNRFSPSKSNKCTPVPLPTTKGFPAAPKLGTPFRAGAGTEDDPLTPADVDEILNRVMSKNDSGDEHGDTVMHDVEEHAAVSPAAGKRGVANGEESDVEMTTIIKDEQHDDSVADGPVKKTKKSKKDKKRRLEESNALDDDESITVSAPKKAKKTKKKKAKKISVEQEHEITMDLDGMTQVDDTMQIDDTTQVELDKQLNETEHGGASETVSAPKDVEELTAEHEVTEIVDEPASTVKKKKAKKSRKGKKAQAEVEEHQVIEIDEDVAPVIYVADTEQQSTEADQATNAATATEFLPASEAKVTKKGRKAKEVTTEPKPEEPEFEQEDTAAITASNVAATMTTNPLLAIAKQVVKFDNNLSFHSETFQGELFTIKQNLAALEQRIQANELRASIRQDILFNALKKVSIKLSASSSPAISGTSQADHHNDRSNSPDSSPASAHRDRLARSVRATTVGPNGSIHSVTPIPLPKLGKRAFSSHHRETPASGAGAGAKAAGAAGTSGAAIAEARKIQDKLLKGFTTEMNAAKDKKTVEIKGALCVKYADDLFKML
ncbi:hypothetical protein B0H65DRAFT_170498 [Neurospora tetraspora]|uniref:Uncharacterized protein n=1 Tax=Neurospora tetraspora TaxID=94610 RepID=A0AAE0JI15_9PEZI|nr:hypothetical protein B0H65DRAFT_170498 [Neurospora tetraspora]